MCIDTTTRNTCDLKYNSIVFEDYCATKDLNFRNRIVDSKDVQIS